MTFDREELLSVLNDARPALSSGGVIPELSHFWFDQKYVYAYDGGLGVRLALKTELDCGIPGKVLLDLLRTSALKQVFLEVVKKTVVLQMGKSKTQIVMLDSERRAWPFPNSTPKKGTSLVLSERLVEALRQVLFVRASKPMKAVHHGVTFEPYKDCVELYATDSKSIAQAIVNERLPTDVPRFVAPWAFLDRILELIEPGATLYVLEDCLMVGAEGTLICSNLLELPEDPDLPKTVDSHLNDSDPIAIPAGLQPILDRARILAGEDDPILTLSVKGSTLSVQGSYALGSVNESLPLKGKMAEVSGKFYADLVVRGLAHSDSFTLGKKALVLNGGESFCYLLAAMSK